MFEHYVCYDVQKILYVTFTSDYNRFEPFILIHCQHHHSLWSLPGFISSLDIKVDSKTSLFCCFIYCMLTTDTADYREHVLFTKCILERLWDQFPQLE